MPPPPPPPAVYSVMEGRRSMEGGSVVLAPSSTFWQNWFSRQGDRRDEMQNETRND